MTLHVAHLITTIDRGGAENQLVELVRMQTQNGLSVTVLPLKGQLELGEILEELGATLDLRYLNKNLMKQVFTARTMKSIEADIFHAHLPKSELLLSISRADNCVVSRHYGGQFWPGAHPWISKMLSRMATRKVRCVIAISEYVKDYLISVGEIGDPRKISVIYYGFSAGRFLSTTTLKSKTYDSNQELTVFGTISRLSEEKDLATLIRGFSKFKQQSPNKNSELRIYGNGHLKEDLENQVKSLGLESSIRFMGRTNQPEQALQEMDVFVLTSNFEGFGMVLLEAMAVGVPIICSRIPTALEVLGDDGAAVYFEVGSAQDLSLKMQDLSSKSPDMSVLQDKYRRRLELFRPQRNYDETHSKYLDLIQTGIAL